MGVHRSPQNWLRPFSPKRGASTVKRSFRPESTHLRRRGVTLVEMLVTVAMLVIIMTILVQVFQAATGRRLGGQAYQQIDDQLRRVDGMHPLRPRGGHRPFTPPLDPPRTSATSSTARTNSPTSRAKTATTTSASPPRPRRAGRSPGECGSIRGLPRTTRP